MHVIFELRMETLQRRRRSPMTIANNKHALRAFDAWLRTRGLDAATVSPLHVEEYFESLLARYQTSTSQRHLTVVRAAYAYAMKLGHVTRDPTATVVLPRVPDAEPATYTNEELRRIHAMANTGCDRRLLHLLSYAGLRRFECVSLRYSDVDFDHKQLRVLGKAGKLRRVPLHPRLEQLLGADDGHDDQAVLRSHYGLPMSVRTVNTRLRTMLRRAGVDGGLRPAHKFRKTVATSLNENGARESAIDQIMGWAPSSIRSRHYTRISDGLSRSAILLLYDDDEALRAPSSR